MWDCRRIITGVFFPFFDLRRTETTSPNMIHPGGEILHPLIRERRDPRAAGSANNDGLYMTKYIHNLIPQVLLI